MHAAASEHTLLLPYYCFTTALLLLYYCFTTEESLSLSHTHALSLSFYVSEYVYCIYVYIHIYSSLPLSRARARALSLVKPVVCVQIREIDTTGEHVLVQQTQYSRVYSSKAGSTASSVCTNTRNQYYEREQVLISLFFFLPVLSWSGLAYTESVTYAY